MNGNTLQGTFKQILSCWKTKRYLIVVNIEMGDIGKLMEDQFLSLLSYVAEQERKIKQRQAEGIALAKSQGRHLGRPKLNLRTLSHEQRQLLDSHYPKWKNKEITGVEFMCLLGLKKNSFYKVVREFEIGI